MTKQNMLAPAPTKEELVADLHSVALPYSNYLDTLDEAKLSRIRKSVSRMRHGLHSVAPIMCMGPKTCLFIEHCPIPPRTDSGAPIKNADGSLNFGPEKDYPMARPCVMETFYMQQKIIDYIDYLNVDPANPVEISIVNELALIDLLKNRCLIILSKGDRKGDGRDFIRTDTVAFDPETGMKSEKSALHPAVEMMDRLEKRRERWLDRLVETRKSRVDMAHKMGTTDKDSKLLDELTIIKNALLKSADSNIQDAEVLELEIDD